MVDLIEEECVVIIVIMKCVVLLMDEIGWVILFVEFIEVYVCVLIEEVVEGFCEVMFDIVWI